MAVYAYIRVSTEHQVAHGEGLAIQRDKILAFAVSRGLEVEEFFTDPAESGATPLEDRPAGRTLLSVLREGDMVILARLDRAWRSLLDAEGTISKWNREGVQLHILDFPVDLSTPFGKVVFQVMAAFAEFERSVIAERIRAGVRAAVVKRGGKWGPVAPYGWRRCKGPEGPQDEPDEKEQEILAVAAEIRASGLGRLGVARGLNALGYTSRNGEPWTEDSVRRAFYRTGAAERGT